MMKITFAGISKYGKRKNYEKDIRILARKIVRRIRKKKVVSKVYYKDFLGDLIDFANHKERKKCSTALGLIWDYCEYKKFPPINFLIVSKETNLPGAGVIGWFRDIYGKENAGYYGGYCDRVIEMVTYHLVTGLLVIEDDNK
jgi:hypothetical protein